MRATTSVLLPAGNGTMKRMDFCGQALSVCASAAGGKRTASNSARYRGMRPLNGLAKPSQDSGRGYAGGCTGSIHTHDECEIEIQVSRCAMSAAYTFAAYRVRSTEARSKSVCANRSSPGPYVHASIPMWFK